MEIEGTFDTQRFFETLATIIGNRENVKITMSVKEEEQQQESEEQKAGWRKIDIILGVAVWVEKRGQKKNNTYLWFCLY